MAQRGSRACFFCSQGNRQTFLVPEQELRRMRRRVGIAPCGGSGPGCVTGCSLHRPGRGHQPAELGAGGSGALAHLGGVVIRVGYTGAWAALQRRALNMVVLIALGTSWFVPAVVAVAFAAFALWSLAGSFSHGLLAFIAVLVISCPCALGWLNPMIAGAAMALRFLSVIVNSALLNSYRKAREASPATSSLGSSE